MKIARCRDQSGTLEQFYGELAGSTDGTSRSIGEAMLRLLQELRSSSSPFEAWGLTSLCHLCLLAEDRYDSPWLVRVIGSNSQYWVEYLLPQNAEPWPNAYVRGEASSPGQAVDMVLTGMRRSEGWTVDDGAAA